MCIFTALIVIILYYPGGLYFLNDDLIHVPLSAGAVFGQRLSLRPVNDFSLYIDSLIWSKDAFGYHLTNLFIHLANCVCIYFFCKKILAFDQSISVASIKAISFFSAMIFAVFAFHSEGVFWIIGRSSELSMLFFFCSYFLYASDKTLFNVLAYITFFLGVFTYESEAVFPVFILLLYLVQRKNLPDKKRLLIKIFFFWIALFICILIHAKILNYAGEAYDTANIVSMNIALLAQNFSRLFIRTFIPPFINDSSLIIASAVLFLILALVLFFILHKKKFNPYFLFFAIILLVSYAPYISLGIDTHGVEGERYLYMPSVFAAMLIVYCIAQLISNQNIQLVLFFFFFLLHIFFLKKAGDNFRMASFVSEKTFSVINNFSNKKILYIQNLPTENNGALIFRLGFEEGISWLKNKETVDSIVVLSVNPDSKYSFKCKPAVHYSQSSQTEVYNFQNIKDNAGKYFLIKKENVFKPGEDVKMVYTDTSLNVYY